MKGKYIHSQIGTFWLKTEMSVSRTYTYGIFCGNINECW